MSAADIAVLRARVQVMQRIIREIVEQDLPPILRIRAVGTMVSLGNLAHSVDDGR